MSFLKKITLRGVLKFIANLVLVKVAEDEAKKKEGKK